MQVVTTRCCKASCGSHLSFGHLYYLDTRVYCKSWKWLELELNWFHSALCMVFTPAIYSMSMVLWSRLIGTCWAYFERNMAAKHNFSSLKVYELNSTCRVMDRVFVEGKYNFLSTGCKCAGSPDQFHSAHLCIFKFFVPPKKRVWFSLYGHLLCHNNDCRHSKDTFA